MRDDVVSIYLHIYLAVVCSPQWPAIVKTLVERSGWRAASRGHREQTPIKLQLMYFYHD